MKSALQIDTCEEKLYVAIAYGICAASLLNLLPGLPPLFTFLVPLAQFVIFRQAKTQFARFGTAQALVIGILLATSDFVLWLVAPYLFDRYQRPLLPIYGSLIVIWIFNLAVTLLCLWMGKRALNGKETNVPVITKVALRIAGQKQE